MASKRQRGESSSQRAPVVAPVDAFPDVIFADEEQRERFINLMGRNVVPSRWIDHSALQRLGISEPMRILFDNLGMSALFTMYTNTHFSLTLEFLSSLREERGHNNRPLLKFRLFNRPRSLSVRQLAEIFGLRSGGDVRIPQNNDSTILYQRFTGRTEINTSHLYLKYVHHPCVRLCLKFFSSCLFGRPDGNVTRTNELNILVKYFMAGNTDVNIHVPAYLWKHLLGISNKNSRQDIVIGGLITRIAMYFNFEDVNEQREDCLLNLQFLTQCGYIAEGAENSYKWKIFSQPPVWSSMPIENLPPLDPNLPHYLLPTAIPPGPSGAPLGPPPVQHASSSGARPQGYTPFEQQMIDNFAQMQIAQEQMRTVMENEFGQIRLAQQQFANRFDHFETQTHMALRPLLDYHHQQGHFYADVQYPDWYTPPPTFGEDEDDQEDDGQGGGDPGNTGDW